MTESTVLKVAARSNPASVAGAIAGVIRKTGRAEVRAIGAGASHKATLAIAIARGYFGSEGQDLVSLPECVELEIDGAPRIAVQFTVVPRVGDLAISA